MLHSWFYTFPNIYDNDHSNDICNITICADDTALYSKPDQAFDL